MAEEPTEEASSAKKEKSFPTATVAGLGIVIMVLSAVTGMICMKKNEKTSSNAVQEEKPVELQSMEHLEKAPTDDSGSNGKNSE
jgi:flagellar basal body-associated protein FliL